MKEGIEETYKSGSSFWSWTFGFVTFPFIFWGCPFYLIIRQPPRHFPLSLIPSTKTWLKRMFDCRISPLGSILSLLLLIPTTMINAYVIYIFGDIFNHLFISGTYDMSMIQDLLGFIRYIPVIIPLNYVWLRGFRINNMIILLNSMYGRYGGAGCGSVRLRVIFLLIVIIGIQVIRYFCYERYELTGKPFLEVVLNILQFSIDFFCALLLPLYCAFNYALRFQLYTVKAILYSLISQRVTPNIQHLDMVKILYTQAADHIVLANDVFSLYLSVALVILFIGTLFDANNLWKALLTIFGSTSAGGVRSQLTVILSILAREFGVQNATMAGDGQDQSVNEKQGPLFTETDVREINADIACVVITYGLMFFTIWQAVGTNDLAREIHVWLNDFATGAGGTDVKSVLLDLGVKADVGRRRKGSDDSVVLVDHREEGGLVWARNSISNCGTQDEFLKKFQMLKAYIHVRMQLEKPALLNITLVGILVPPLSGRLRNYQLRF